LISNHSNIVELCIPCHHLTAASQLWRGEKWMKDIDGEEAAIITLTKVIGERDHLQVQLDGVIEDLKRCFKEKKELENL